MWTFGILAVMGVAVTAFWILHLTTRPPQAPLTIVPATSYPGWEGMPSFSPDGNQLAFVWDGEKRNNNDIYVKLIGNPGSLLLGPRGQARAVDP